MSRICEGRVAIVTGAGRGLGREHALELARQGARVVVNDLGAAPDGAGTSADPANEVVALIEAAGGEAVANGDDVADFAGAAGLVRQAVDTFGGLDVLVNNAGFLRDRMLVNTAEEEWDAVVRVHLKGHFAPLRHAAAYSAAKAGIAGLTLVAAQELARYGVTVNAIAPAARTRMTEAAFADTMAAPESGFDTMHPRNVSPVVAWLASEDSGDLTGLVIEVEGGKICVEEGWRHGPAFDIGARWLPDEVGPALRKLVGAAAVPEPVYGA